MAEVQNGLGWLATANPLAGICFSYDIQNVNLVIPAPIPPRPTSRRAGATRRWARSGSAPTGTASAPTSRTSAPGSGRGGPYCGFFTKYPLGHFAYASIGGPRLVMDYNNDGWGPDNIDRVFAHETGHIFGCPDEYAEQRLQLRRRLGPLRRSPTATARTAPAAAACPA